MGEQKNLFLAIGLSVAIIIALIRIWDAIKARLCRRRIAAGSGTTIQEVNRMLKQHRQMADMAKKMQGDKLGRESCS